VIARAWRRPSTRLPRVAALPAASTPGPPERLLHVDPAAGRFADRRAAELPALLGPGDLVVVNDAATLPASLRAGAPGGPLEVRLIAALEEPSGPAWLAVLLGAGDWRTPTERRPAPPPVQRGERLVIDGGALSALVEGVDDGSGRLVRLRFDRGGAALWSALLRLGRPVQYAHTPDPLPLEVFQTAFAGAPWASEMPSAGRALPYAALAALRARGVEVVALTHATGPSSTGHAAIDAALPLPERTRVPPRTAAAVERARAEGRRVVAVGTSVVRALEGRAAASGHVTSGEAITDHLVGPSTPPRVVSGLVTGLHEPGSSHLALLAGFAPAPLLERAYAHAAGAGYRAHELGDLCLILGGARGAPLRASPPKSLGSG
jgi:S-adenosylmethionine:tRNA ribosyltransferase-isomerase